MPGLLMIDSPKPFDNVSVLRYSQFIAVRAETVSHVFIAHMKARFDALPGFVKVEAYELTRDGERFLRYLTDPEICRMHAGLVCAAEVALVNERLRRP